MNRRPTDPAALTDTHSPDHWTTAGSHYARLAGDFERIDALGGVRGALARLEQHLADGCPTTHHRHITDGTCRHVLREGPSVASGGVEPPRSYEYTRTGVAQPRNAPNLPSPSEAIPAPPMQRQATTAVRATLRQICGEPLPCPLHPQAVLEGVEAEVARRAETHALGTRLTRETENAWVALGRLMATVSQIAKLAPVEKVAVERCCGGWSDAQRPCERPADDHYRVRGVAYPVCLTCRERCRKADQRAERKAG